MMQKNELIYLEQVRLGFGSSMALTHKKTPHDEISFKKVPHSFFCDIK